MAFKPPLTVKNWRNTRPNSCKESGVGKAIEAFLKVDQDPEKIPRGEKVTTALSDLLEAAKDLDKALDDAEGKIDLKKDPKQGKATAALISSWKGELESYFEKLETRKENAIEGAEKVVKTREAALEIATEYVKKYRNWAKTISDYVTNAKKHLKEAESTKREGDRLQNQVAIDLVMRYRDEGTTIFDECEGQYTANFKQGVVLDSRSDGATWGDALALDPGNAKKLKEKSNKLFAECTILTNEINELRDSIDTQFNELKTLALEADSFSMAGADPEKYVKILTESAEEAATMAKVLDTTLQKVKGMARGFGELLKGEGEKSERLAKLELMEEKQFLPRAAILKESAKTPPIIERRVRAVPKPLLDEYATVREAQAKALEEVQNLTSLMNQAVQQMSQLGKTIPKIKAALQ